MKFRNGSASVDAVRWLGGPFPPLTVGWVFDALGGGTLRFASEDSLEVTTPSGVTRASPGDWLVLDAEGGLSPYANDIFLQTYEPA